VVGEAAAVRAFRTDYTHLRGGEAVVLCRVLGAARECEGYESSEVRV